MGPGKDSAGDYPSRYPEANPQPSRYNPVAALLSRSTSYRGPKALSGRGRSTRRISAILAIVVFLSFLLVLYRRINPNMSKGSSANDPHFTKETLNLKLEKTDINRPAVRVTLTNYHSSTSVSVLIWNTPFDPQAVALGVFKVTDRETKQDIPPLGVKINRLLPPSREDFLELKPRHAVTKDVYLDAPSIELVKGKTYDFQALGKWKAVWHASVLDIGEENLKRIGGPSGPVNWDFESNVFPVEIQ